MAGFLKKLKRIVFREDPVCPWWLAYSFDNPLRRFLHDPNVLLGAHVKPGMVAADIGCGLGYFSLGLARLVGASGKVLAVDLQQQMLDRMRRRAEKQGLGGTILSVLAAQDDIRITGQVDFALCFWMVHEVPDMARFFRQVFSVLRGGGKVLISEPRLHVPGSRFQEELKLARDAGFIVVEAPSIRMSRSALLLKQ
jgi:2-polyprenyl-3-methyl-5-hydroxy-6-metoxy-1,4-benzoquinol methylase